MMRELACRGINEVHVEAGAKLNGALMRAGLVDELVVYLAGAIVGDPARGMFEFPAPLESLAARVPLEWMSVDRIGTDVRIVARVRAASIGAG
jgi:diaminohydroxyphosphoribosylaminopyrimidine deaminase/5-amino-6-(5-phosphoribosylamino)uracil reductase